MVRRKERNIQMLADQRSGLSLRQIARKYETSPQNVRISCMRESARSGALTAFEASESDLSTKAINLLRGAGISTLSKLRERIEASVLWRVSINRCFNCGQKIFSEIESFAVKNRIPILPLDDFTARMILRVMDATHTPELPKTSEVREFFAEHPEWSAMLAISMRHRPSQLREKTIGEIEDFLRNLESHAS